MAKMYMIVDDSVVTRKMIRLYIEKKIQDVTILDAPEGNEAIRLAELNADSLDVITVDVNMPGEDGITVAEKLRVICPKARIFILTANIQNSIRSKASEGGFGFIEKPVSEAKLQPIFEQD